MAAYQVLGPVRRTGPSRTPHVEPHIARVICKGDHQQSLALVSRRGDPVRDVILVGIGRVDERQVALLVGERVQLGGDVGAALDQPAVRERLVARGRLNDVDGLLDVGVLLLARDLVVQVVAVAVGARADLGARLLDGLDPEGVSLDGAAVFLVSGQFAARLVGVRPQMCNLQRFQVTGTLFLSHCQRRTKDISMARGGFTY
jgi:hypothetical protein